MLRALAAGTILALTTLAVAVAAPVAQASALCNGNAKVDLDIGAAASVPRMKGDQLSTFGTSGAQQQAAMGSNSSRATRTRCASSSRCSGGSFKKM